MKKVFAVLIFVILLLLLSVSCSSDSSVDEAFNCTITFNGNGATEGEMSAQTIGIGIPTELNANTFGKTDFDFIGWNTKADGSGKSYSDGQVASITKNTILYAQWGTFLTESMTSWEDGCRYVLNSNVTFESRIHVSGSVTLILNDGYTLTASNGICVNENNSLTINANGEGTGILEATGIPVFAGIGGDLYCISGTITINGGTVNASAESGAAGIGGGSEGSGGTITINGGTVNASAKTSGSGIGGGQHGNGGTITINGGTVNASSGFEAGIGRGYDGDSDGTLTLGKGITLEVSNDYYSNWSDYDGNSRKKYMRTKYSAEAFNRTITFNGNGATAGEMSVQTVGAGIPTELNANTFEKTDFDFMGWNTKKDGSGKPYSDGQVASIIENTTLYAQWGTFLTESKAFWEDGCIYVLNSDVTIFGHIEVSGSATLILNDGYTLTAHSGIVVNEGNSLTIKASGEGTGILEAIGKAGYAGIGGCFQCHSGTIIINGGTVNANAEGGGAGIGGGFEGFGGTITINGGIVNASSDDNGAGIGGGQHGNGGTIRINGGKVNASSGFGAGIGGGFEGFGGTIIINGGIVSATSNAGVGIGKGNGGDSDGTLTLGKVVALEVSSNNSDWSDYDGTTRQKYMRTK